MSLWSFQGARGPGPRDAGTRISGTGLSKLSSVRLRGRLATARRLLANNTARPARNREAAACQQHCAAGSQPRGGRLPTTQTNVEVDILLGELRSEERRVGKECRSRWS